MAAAWVSRFQPLIERARAEKERRIAEFLAAGGECLRCFDQGECPECERGRAAKERGDERRIQEFVALAGLPPRFLQASFASYPGPAQLRDRVAAFLADWDFERNLILFGPYGVGKTGLMAGAIRALAPGFMELRCGIVFTTTPALFDRLKAGFDDGSFHQTMQLCQRADLLILDDLGVEKPTEWVQERLYAIVNDRYERRRPTWATTNRTGHELQERLGERTWWRLQEGAELMIASGPNLRAKTL